MDEELELETIEGVGPVTKQKLKDAGIHNLLDLIVRGPLGVSDATGLDIDKATAICNKARIKLVELGKLEKDFVTATEIYKRRQAIERISTGSKNLDELLGGGIETQAITEIYGEYGTGKTQICHTLCVMVQLPKDQGGLEGSAIYIDTEGTFRPERVYKIAEAKGYDPEQALENIMVAKAYNSSHQELILEEVGRMIEKLNARLLIIDSAIAHYRAEFLGRGTLAERQQRINKFMHMLVRLAETYNIAVVATNQIQASPDTFFGDPFRPTGGHVVAHTSTYRVYLKRSGRNRIARMVDSPYHPEREVLFILTEGGVADPEEKKKKA
ncbi:MAG: DNA repair and recombination protein RadA [Candidatus Nitrosocaldaceae archaeon]|nr:MAG: DNA repair and recombination protein RadA [Candidatus Nitrosocaldaceae archaeon]